MVCVVIALAATFLSEHYGGPQLLYALLIGLAFHFLNSNANVKTGVDFCGRVLLRVGVALLGARITLTQVAKLGVETALVIVVAVALTILFGLLLAKWLKRPREEGVLSGGAVAICGASAALAISSVLPQTKENERFTLLAVVGVTVLSTLSMILYPFALKLIGLEPAQGGIFLGGTLAFAKQRQSQVRELGQVRHADGAEARHHRVHLEVQQIDAGVKYAGRDA